MAHEAIFGPAILLRGFALPCSSVTMSRDGAGDAWAIKAFDVPTDALRPLRSAIGPAVGPFELCLTDHAGRQHRGRGVIQRATTGELGYRLTGDHLSLVFRGEID